MTEARGSYSVPGGARLIAGLLAAMACGACSSPDPADAGDDDLAEGCDIRRRGCQETIFAAAAKLRGQPGTDVPEVRTITREEFAAGLSEGQTTDAGADTLTPALTALGLLEGGTSAVDASESTRAQNVAAFYSEETKQVTVIDGGTERDALEGTFELAHEFVHVLQDRSVDLGAFRKRWVTSWDSYLATTSLVEGEAMVLGIGVLTEAMGMPAASYRWDFFVDSIMHQIFGDVSQSGTPFFYSTQLLPYPLGTRKLYPEWLEKGSAGISDLFAQPMLSLLDWTEISAIGQPRLVEPLDCHPTQGPPGFTGIDHDTFGVAGFFALGVQLGIAPSDAYAQSLDWRNDSVVAFRDDANQDSYAVAWRVRFSSAGAQATVAASAWTNLAVPVTTQSFDRELLILGATDPTVIAGWTEASHCGTAAELPTPEAADGTTTTALARRMARQRPAPPRGMATSGAHELAIRPTGPAIGRKHGS